MKVIQYLINNLLPEDIRDYNRSYDKKSMNELLTIVADKYPDKYKEIIDGITKITGKSVYLSGETVTLDDFKPLFNREDLYKRMDNEVATIRKNVKNKTLRNTALREIRERYADLTAKLTKEHASKTHNNLYNAVVSGARGNDFQFKAMVTTPALYTDYKDETIPLFIRRSYADGLSLPEYLAGTFGTRNSNMTIKRGTGKAGGLSKEIVRAVADSVINTDKDISNNGIDLDIDDDSLYGRVLARTVGDIPRGTVIDRPILNKLQKTGIKKVIVHSPIATIAAEGLSAEAFGLDYNKRLPSIGSHVGNTASTAVTEPFIQGNLCLWEDTPVLMADGKSIKKLKDIKIGDWVMGYNKKLKKIEPVKVTNVFYQGMKECYKNSYKTKSVISTLDHKFLDNYNNVLPIKNLNNLKIINNVNK